MHFQPFKELRPVGHLGGFYISCANKRSQYTLFFTILTVGLI